MDYYQAVESMHMSSIRSCFYSVVILRHRLTQQCASHPTVPSNSSLISPVHRAFVCMWTVLVAGILSLAIVGVRPGARN